MERLAADWAANVTRFDRADEALLAAFWNGVLAGIGGLTIDPVVRDALRMRRVLGSRVLSPPRHRPHAGQSAARQAQKRVPIGDRQCWKRQCPVLGITRLLTGNAGRTYACVGEMRFPVSVKGVLLEDDRVVLLLNERAEWELPRGRLERGEGPIACLEREFAEEFGAAIVADGILDCWLYRPVPGKEVLIVTYAVRRMDRREFVVSREHREFGVFPIGELESLPMPEGYRRSIRSCAGRGSR